MQVYGNTDLLGTPYTPPWQLTLNLWAEFVDKSQDTSAGQTVPALWRALKAQLPGDIVTIDPTVSYEFAGDYEITGRTFNPMQQEVEDTTDGGFIQATTRSVSFSRGTDQNSGVLQLVLRTFNRSAAIFTDVSVAANSSFATVPGQLPYAGLVAGEGSATFAPIVVTVGMPWQPGPDVYGWISAPAFVVDYSGRFVQYPGFGASVLAGSGPWSAYLVEGGALVAYVVPTADLPSGSDILVLGAISTLPAMPSEGGLPNLIQVTFTD
jgi:hypothetical protein